MKVLAITAMLQPAMEHHDLREAIDATRYVNGKSSDEISLMSASLIDAVRFRPISATEPRKALI
jgi:hypothetical protein